jgi:hypothetical protein
MILLEAVFLLIGASLFLFFHKFSLLKRTLISLGIFCALNTVLLVVLLVIDAFHST